jgi:mono/diheme cytochrome c family protein
LSNHGGSEHKGSPVATYTLIALVLGTITFIEFAAIQWRPDWISTGWLVFWLVALSVLKFYLVVAIFMHLKDDENTYSGFFTTGMVLALGTFVVLGFLFTTRSVLPVWATHNITPTVTSKANHSEERSSGHGIPHGISENTLAAIETDGYSRTLVIILDTPRPKNQGTLRLTPPTPKAGDFDLNFEPYQPEMRQYLDPESNIVPTPEGSVSESNEDVKLPSEGEDAPSFDGELALKSFNENCSACHQSTGLGLPGVFPPLIEHAANIYNSNGGREYLIHLPLFGLEGPIGVLGESYNGLMARRQLVSDEDIALALNHAVTSWGNIDRLETFRPFLPNEVATIREKSLSGSEVHALRQSLKLP